MLTSPDEVVIRDERPGYRPFQATVLRVRELSPTFRRVTFGGPEFDTFGAHGLDQRVKILFPLSGVGISDVGLTGDWYTRWRALADEERNPFRTYTVRDIRVGQRELDIDFAIHGDGGPAARWLRTAAEGDVVVIVGPDARSVNSAIGIDWHPGTASQVLLAGDETAAPAICAILESLDSGMRARAFIEVPTSRDFLEIQTDAAAEVTWIARDAGSERLDTVMRSWLSDNAALVRPSLAVAPQQVEEIDVDLELLWDSPAATSGEFYAWIAGESALVKGIRRLLVTETGIDRSRVAFMGYWRLGKAEAQ